MDVNQSSGFKILGADDAIYGPVELPTLVDWVRDERVTSDTWIYQADKDAWHKASNLHELQMFFHPSRSRPSLGSPDTNFTTKSSVNAIRLNSLRRVKILADLGEDQLQRFVEFMELQQVRQWTEVVRQNDAADAMYLVLDGELRVRMMIAGKESILTTLGAGEFFGEVALFDHGPRSADVVANRDSTLLKIGAGRFEEFLRDAPDLAAPILFAIGKTLVARIRADNKRHKDSIHMARAASAD